MRLGVAGHDQIGLERIQDSFLVGLPWTDTSKLAMHLQSGALGPKALPRHERDGSGISCQLRSEEHTSELQSQSNLVCRLLLEKKKNIITNTITSLSDICHSLPCAYTLLCNR